MSVRTGALYFGRLDITVAMVSQAKLRRIDKLSIDTLSGIDRHKLLSFTIVHRLVLLRAAAKRARRLGTSYVFNRTGRHRTVTY